ncbi:hypothetical protein FNQ90_13260 [Streptomyces alkaliphilus]|uniref:Uncharacterized protein n=1 Tax=Streptomyces alkaliphilus TaxID=1472722 RepID=A0A7W3Y281_9ACTN|nr:hypothetical protein [Streptomyces alkaliphilus]MBB0245050.1 hypothetical protein [Streptomyces alkaliphilus]
MFRLVRTTTLRAATDRAAELEDTCTALTEATATITALTTARDEAQQYADGLHEVLRQCAGERDTARAELARLEGELETLRAQQLLDTEDRAVLRMLLRTARKQRLDRLDRVYVLFRYGALHSVHASLEAAEGTAEAEGASPDGWTSHRPGAGMPSAAEVTWRVQPLALGGRPMTTPHPA